MEPDCRDCRFNDNLSEIADKQIDRVEQEQALHVVAVAVNGIENGGHVHQQHGKYRPQILDIPEKDEQRGQNQSYTDVEQHQAGDRIEQQDKFPGERDPVQNTEQKKHAEGQAKVDERLHVLREQEKILGDIHLGEDARVAHKGGHPLAGGLVEAGEDQVAAEEVGRVVGGGASEELGEYHFHDQQRQQRGQNAPGHAQDCALVLLFEVAFDQFLEEELVSFEFLDHGRAPFRSHRPESLSIKASYRRPFFNSSITSDSPSEVRSSIPMINAKWPWP